MRLQKPLLFLCVLCLHPTYAQQTAAPRAKPNLNATLAKPAIWSRTTIRMFKDSTREVSFVLNTSWIPGPDHKGMFRYKLTGLPERRSAADQLKANEVDTLESTEKFLDRVHTCDITLVLYDSDDFVLRRVSVILQRVVNDDAQVVNLLANSSVQMDQQEYVSLIGTSGKFGRFDINWGGCQ